MLSTYRTILVDLILENSKATAESYYIRIKILNFTEVNVLSQLIFIAAGPAWHNVTSHERNQSRFAHCESVQAGGQCLEMKITSNGGSISACDVWKCTMHFSPCKLPAWWDVVCYAMVALSSLGQQWDKQVQVCGKDYLWYVTTVQLSHHTIRCSLLRRNVQYFYIARKSL